MPTAKTRKASAKPSEVETLRAQLAAAEEELAAAKAANGKSHKTSDRPGGAAGTKLTVSEAQVKALTVEDMDALRYGFVQKDDDDDLVVERGDSGKKQYALIKGVKREWYMALKGFVTTLNANGELSSEPNAKGRSQMLYAREILSEIQAAGFINLGTPGKAGRRKSA